MNHAHEIKNAAKQLLFRSGLYRLNRLKNECFILAYHMIGSEPAANYPRVSIADFESHVSHISQNYRIVPLDELVRRIGHREPVRGCVAITFDDGFKDNYTNAYPILRRYGAPATIFLATSFIDKGKAPWFIRVRHAFLHTPRTSFEFPLGDRPAERIPMRNQQQRMHASDILMEHLKACPNDERLAILDRLFDYLRVEEPSHFSQLMLSWEEIKEMVNNGISFGAHTANHPVLTRVPLDAAMEEVTESKRAIEERTGLPVTNFAYPFGKRDHYSHDLFRVLESSGFHSAVTTEAGSNGLKSNLFALRRSAPWELDLVK